MTAPTPHPAPARHPWLLVGLAILGAGVPALSSPGSGVSAWLSAGVVAERTLTSGSLATCYFLAGIGLGALFTPLTRNAQSPRLLRAGLGLALLLLVSQLLGVAGLLAGKSGAFIGAAPIIAGLGLMLRELVPILRRGLALEVGPAMVPFALAGAIFLVACSNPPGWLWQSEAGGYDVLSYHLELPRQWVAQDRLSGLHNNVYSYLPSYVEGAYYHLASLGSIFAPHTPGDLVAGEGTPVYACQFLHALFTLLAAIAAGRAGELFYRRAGLGEPTPVLRTVTTSLVLLTPWTIVTGSLAYNDMAMIAFFVIGALGALDLTPPPLARSVIVGLLAAAACACKPTALTFCAAPLGAMLLLGQHPRRWATLSIPGAACALLFLSPWLLRNLADTHNPVFPFAASIFAAPGGGTGHWSAEQVGRFSLGHHFDGTWADRLRLCVLPDQNDPAGVRERGFLHAQWGAFFPLVLVACFFLFARRATRRPGSLILGLLVFQTLVWLTTTHIQSRFLLPLLPAGSVAVAIMLARVPHTSARHAVAAMLVTATGAWSITLFAQEHAGQPNTLLVGGVEFRTGEAFRDDLAHAQPGPRQQFLDAADPTLWVNLALPESAKVYLLGDATPLYFKRPVVWNTTWDAWPIAASMAQSPDNPSLWSERLREQGITHVLVNLREIDRLQRSGFAPPGVSPASVSAWMLRATRPVHAWPDAGVYLVEPGKTP